jgi:RND superfamily putative drug exporter
MSGMFEFLGRCAVTHPWKTAAAWVLIAGIVAVAAPSWESSAQDDDIRFLPDRCRSVRGYQMLERAFPQEVFASRAIFAVERRKEALRPADFALVDHMVAELEKLRQAEPELRLGNVSSYRDGVVGKRLTSDDGRCTLIQLSLGTPYLAIQTQQSVDRAESRLKPLLAAAGGDPPLLLTTGAAGVGRDLIRASGASLERTTLATILLVVLILILVYRAPLLALVPLITIAVSVWVAVHLLALLTLIPGVHLVNISKVFTIVILYGAGTDYCLFLISRYREELSNGHAQGSAIRHSIVAVGAALAASAGTVICGLSLMGFAEFAKVRCAGPAIALALAVALAAALTLTPALLRLLGGAVFWPARVPGPDFLPLAGGVRTHAPGPRDTGPGNWDGLWDRLSRLVVARPMLVWTVSVLLLLPLAIIGLRITPAYKPTGELSAMSPSIQGMGAIQRHFTLGETGPLTVMLSAAADWNTPEGRELTAQVSSALAHMDNVAEVRSLTQPLGQPLPLAAMDAPPQGILGNIMRVVHREVGGALDQANQAAREHYLATMPSPQGPRYVTRFDVVLRSDPFDAASMATLEQMETWLRDELPRCPPPMGWVEAECFGQTVHSRDLALITEQDRTRVNLFVLAGIFLILVALIGQIGMAGYLLLTVLFSYYATLGATALFGLLWLGQPLGQMDWRVPFFLFTILVAVGEDYNILLVSRILQERKGGDPVEGVRRGLSRTGGTITACGLIMAGTFATLMLAGLNTLVQVGFALAFGVLLDTFLVRPFLVPTLLLMYWRWKRRGKAKWTDEPETLLMRRSA